MDEVDGSREALELRIITPHRALPLHPKTRLDHLIASSQCVKRKLKKEKDT